MRVIPPSHDSGVELVADQFIDVIAPDLRLLRRGERGASGVVGDDLRPIMREDGRGAIDGLGDAAAEGIVAVAVGAGDALWRSSADGRLPQAIFAVPLVGVASRIVGEVAFEVVGDGQDARAAVDAADLVNVSVGAGFTEARTILDAVGRVPVADGAKGPGLRIPASLRP